MVIEKLLQFFVGEVNAELLEPVELHGVQTVTGESKKYKQTQLECVKYKVCVHIHTYVYIYIKKTKNNPV